MSLKRAAATGVRWTGVAAALTAGLQFAQLAVLANLLAPEDFGLMAMVMVVLGLAQIYADLGVSNAIIHRQDATREQLSSLYWLTVLVGVAVYLIVIAMLPVISALFDEPRLSDLIPVVALLFLIVPLGRQFQVLLEKNLKFKDLALIESSGAVAGTATAISTALAGHGVYSLVYGQLAGSTWRTLALIGIGCRHWRPRLRFRLRDLRGYVSFGMFQMGEKSVGYLAARLDQALIGALLGAQALGYYSLAHNLVAHPISQINPVLTRVAFPILARVQNDRAKLETGFMTMRNLLAMVNFPLLLGAAAVAPVLVPLVLGEQWLPSVVLIQILAPVAMVRSLGNPIGSLLLAVGRPDLGFYINCALFVAVLPAIYFGVQLGGLVGVAWALLLTVLVFFWVGYFFLVRRLLGPCLPRYLAAFGPATLTAGLMAAAVAGLAWVTPLDGYVLLFAQLTTGALLYPILNWLLYRERTVATVRLVLDRGS